MFKKLRNEINAKEVKSSPVNEAEVKKIETEMVFDNLFEDINHIIKSANLNTKLLEALVTPEKDESQDDFISRFMSDELSKKEFPDDKQRVAVAFTQWNNKKSIKETTIYEFPRIMFGNNEKPKSLKVNIDNKHLAKVNSSKQAVDVEPVLVESRLFGRMQYGLVAKQKYPLFDAQRVVSTIRFFNNVKEEDQAELAANIVKQADKFKVDLKIVPETSALFKYLPREDKQDSKEASSHLTVQSPEKKS
jgi:hypothetical protein